MTQTISPQEFVAKWSKIQQKETAVSQSHFNDVCALIGHLSPLEFDPAGDTFSFETQTVKPGGAKGFADVYFKGKFIWEYKGPHKDLDKAYQQLQLYREDLQNPPLLITSDIHTIIIHTNFNNYPTVRYTISFDDIVAGDGVQKLRWAFTTPEKFQPEQTQAQITKATADTFLHVAQAIKEHRQMTDASYSDEQIAHFMARLLFCLFAEDLDLLPNQIFSQMVQAQSEAYSDIHFGLRNLFREMRHGGTFGFYRIRYFDGTLFDDDFVPDLPADLGQKLLQAAQQDWSQVDPAIFGTLFERVIDEGKRAQLGAHYTSVADIMLIVEPVLMQPLRQKWDEVRRQVDRLLRDNQTLGVLETPRVSAGQLLADFATEIAAIRVLDPACGSGNFLYVALRQLLDLQKQVIAYGARHNLPAIALSVSPEQLYGIEINAYAHELAQITAWIGYLQWRHENGFGEMEDPILRPLKNIQRMDAILAYDENGRPVEPEWPAADVIIGNPPFLGAKQMIGELSESYVYSIRQLYAENLSGFTDLVTYWFEKSRKQIERNLSKRVGLIATNSIRVGTNIKVLKNIKETGDIFMAWSDREWLLDGAAVRVSVIGFDDGTEKNIVLDGISSTKINSDLTAHIDLTVASKLIENARIAFIGTQRSGPFDITKKQARIMLEAKNESGMFNSDVVRPQYNSRDIIVGSRNVWVIDFGKLSESESARYEMPFNYVKEHVYPIRTNARRKAHKEKWWQLAETRQGMKSAIGDKIKYIATPIHAKHRLFVWLDTIILPDHALTAIARDDDYFFGVLHSRVHEMWALRLGTWLGKGNDPRYTPTTTFETFPFPWPPGQEPSEAEDARVAEIGHWAHALTEWRQAWLNPPRTDLYDGVGDAYEKMVKKRTLTNLYNGLVYYRQTRPQGSGRPLGSHGDLFLQAEFDKVTRKSVTRADIQELDDIHAALDDAVLDAYGWLPSASSGQALSDEEILEHLLALNLERAAGQR